MEPWGKKKVWFESKKGKKKNLSIYQNTEQNHNIAIMLYRDLNIK